MYKIGIDVGSAYTKYCIMKDGQPESLFMEKTPICQREYFSERFRPTNERYAGAEIISCGYGKNNIPGLKHMNELTALARGCYFVTGKDGMILDVGGQDTKIIFQERGRLKAFFINDKCAAGSGMFLSNTLDMMGIKFWDIDLTKADVPQIRLSSICAVFAQSEIVELIADNRSAMEIVQAVIWQIFVKAKPLLFKLEPKSVFLSGGLSQIKGIDKFAAGGLGVRCDIPSSGAYMSAIGCAMS